MAIADLERPKAIRGLPGATILHILPGAGRDACCARGRRHGGRAVALGARVLVAAEDGPLDSELQGLGGEWVRFVTESANPIATTRNARTLSNLVATERVDLVHAVGAGASRSAAALKKRAGIWVVHTYDTSDLARPHRDRSYSRALGSGDRVIVPSHYVAEQVAAAIRWPARNSRSYRGALTARASIRPRSVPSARWCCAAAGKSRAASAWC